MKQLMANYIRNVLEIDDQETIDDFISDYLVLITELFGKMQVAFANKEFFELRTLAHTLKGSSANIGEEPVRALSLQLQEAADAKDAVLCESLLIKLEALKGAITE